MNSLYYCFSPFSFSLTKITLLSGLGFDNAGIANIRDEGWKACCDLCVTDSQENLWNLWGSLVGDWETVSKKKSSQIKVWCVNYLQS